MADPDGPPHAVGPERVDGFPTGGGAWQPTFGDEGGDPDFLTDTQRSDIDQLLALARHRQNRGRAGADDTRGRTDGRANIPGKPQSRYWDSEARRVRAIEVLPSIDDWGGPA